MILTERYKDIFPGDLLKTYEFAETRDATAILQATDPDAFQDLIDVLTNFYINLDMLYRPGGRLSKIAEALDLEFRKRGWRKGRYTQQIKSTLHVLGWKDTPEPESDEFRNFIAEAEAHEIDNIKNRSVVDIEWNPKDGNLDRDISNYVALYEGGVISAGTLILRSKEFGENTAKLFKEIKPLADAIPETETSASWLYRKGEVSNNPYGTSTTANFSKVIDRLRRGDGKGCPILAIGIKWDRFIAPSCLEAELLEISRSSVPAVPRAKSKYNDKWKQISGISADRLT